VFGFRAALQRVTEAQMTGRLLIENVPVECKDDYLKNWIEARGYRTFNVTMIRDAVSGTSPSFARVQLMDATKLDEAARSLNGRNLLGRFVNVTEVSRYSANRFRNDK
jgi:hypothetical protein